MTVSQSSSIAVATALPFWEKARMPTKREEASRLMLKNIHEAYVKLKKNRLTPGDPHRHRAREMVFKADMDDLFDIAHHQVFSLMGNEEDKVFLRMQRDDPTSCSMVGADLTLSNQEARKRQRATAEHSRRARSNAAAAAGAANDLQSTSASSALSSSSENSDRDDPDDEDFRAPSTPPAASPPKRPRMKQVITPQVVAALDRVTLPSRGATFVAAALVQGMGVDLADVSLSRNTIHRARNVARQEFAQASKCALNRDELFLLHWDGKLLHEIASGTKQLVDSVAILVTGGGDEQ